MKRGCKIIVVGEIGTTVGRIWQEIRSAPSEAPRLAPRLLLFLLGYVTLCVRDDAASI